MHPYATLIKLFCLSILGHYPPHKFFEIRLNGDLSAPKTSASQFHDPGGYNAVISLKHALMIDFIRSNHL